MLWLRRAIPKNPHHTTWKKNTIHEYHLRGTTAVAKNDVRAHKNIKFYKIAFSRSAIYFIKPVQIVWVNWPHSTKLNPFFFLFNCRNAVIAVAASSIYFICKRKKIQCIVISIIYNPISHFSLATEYTAVVVVVLVFRRSFVSFCRSVSLFFVYVSISQSVCNFIRLCKETGLRALRFSLSH